MQGWKSTYARKRRLVNLCTHLTPPQCEVLSCNLAVILSHVSFSPLCCFTLRVGVTTPNQLGLVVKREKRLFKFYFIHTDMNCHIFLPLKSAFLLNSCISVGIMLWAACSSYAVVRLSARTHHPDNQQVFKKRKRKKGSGCSLTQTMIEVLLLAKLNRAVLLRKLKRLLAAVVMNWFYINKTELKIAWVAKM